MDKKDAASDACAQTIRDFIMPNVESMTYSIAQTMPDYSTRTKEGTKLIWVTFFKVKNSTDFMDVLKRVSSAIKTTEGNNRGYW